MSMTTIAPQSLPFPFPRLNLILNKVYRITFPRKYHYLVLSFIWQQHRG
uniref:Uncharacterized protein n=1 Tax=Rhizophora mucronata TaxID=61149 RepID=A0A2P2NRN7_RHIMU